MVVGASDARKTVDGGFGWIPIGVAPGLTLRDVQFPVDFSTGYVVGDDGLILRRAME
jgi:hypothetical protein